MGFVPRLVFAYGGIFTAMGVQLPFLPLWLGAKGLDDRLIGITLALAAVARLVSIPLATAATDRLGDLRRGIAASALGLALSYTALAQVDGVAAIFVLFALGAGFSAGLLPLIEGYALTGLGRLRRAYGPVRMWGSAFFILGNLGAGLLVAALPAQHLIWILVAICWCEGAAALALRPLRMPTRESATRTGFRAVLAASGVAAMLIAAACVQASHAVYYAFSTIQWSQAGLGGGTIGALWSLGVIAEIVLFALSPRFPAWLTPPALLLLGAAGAALRWLVMGFDPPVALLPLLQGLHALSFGATHLASVQFLAGAAAPGAGASAQGLLALATGLAMAVAMAVSGELYAALGAAAYWPMALLAALGAGVGILVMRRRRYPHSAGAGG